MSAPRDGYPECGCALMFACASAVLVIMVIGIVIMRWWG